MDLNVRDLSMSAGSRTRRLPRAVSNIAALLRRRATQALFYPPTDAAMGNGSYQTFAHDRLLQSAVSILCWVSCRRAGLWLYVQYVPTSGLKLRLGRVALATFLTSDSREVGYAQPWFRSPNEVYGQEPFFYLGEGHPVA